MRNAYALLGLAFIIVFGGAYMVIERAYAPSPETLLIKNETPMTMKLTSPAFNDGSLIPALYTCDGDNSHPPLTIENVPEGAQSLALVMDDPDIPEVFKEKLGIEKFSHWSVYNIPSDTAELKTGEVVGNHGMNTKGEEAYTGPCPPTEYEPTTHRYIFRLYALSGTLDFVQPPTLDEVEASAQSMMLEKAELVGLYSKVAQ